MKNKKAQFYIVAALILVGVILVFVANTHYEKTKQRNEAIYNIADDFESETAFVLASGIANKGTDLGALFEEWVKNFTEYAKTGDETWVFVYVNNEDISASTFIGVKRGDGGVGVGGLDVFKSKEVVTGTGSLVIGELEVYINEDGGVTRIVMETESEIIYNETLSYDPNKQNVWFLLQTETATVSEG